MSKETYSIPTGPTARYDFQRNAIVILTPNVPIWKIPTEKILQMSALATTYELTYAVANNKSTQSPAATAARDAAWSPLEVALIDIYDHYLINNDFVSAADKEALHIHSSSGNPGTSSPAPTSTPVIALVSEEISVLHVVYSDSTAPGTHYKPGNVAFCELNYKVGDPAPAGVAECTERYNIGRSHEAVVFGPDQRGKTIYTYARWVNRNGKLGPWSNMVSALIP